MWRRTYAHLFRPQLLFQPWIVRLLRLLDRMNSKFLNGLVIHGKAVARTSRHLPTLGGLALPIGLSRRKFRSGHFVQSAFALARLEGLLLHPVPFRISGETRRSFSFSSAKRNRPSPG